MTTIRELLQEPLLLIIVILFVGSLLGEISYKGLRIGSSGILLVGMLFGHLGYEVPAVVQNIGLSTFITAVGLQAGPRFFKMMKSSGIVFGILGIRWCYRNVYCNETVSFFSSVRSWINDRCFIKYTRACGCP